MECAKRKNKVNFDDKGKKLFFLGFTKVYILSFIYFQSTKKGKVKKPQADPFILKGLTGGG